MHCWLRCIRSPQISRSVTHLITWKVRKWLISALSKSSPPAGTQHWLWEVQGPAFRLQLICIPLCTYLLRVCKALTWSGRSHSPGAVGYVSCPEWQLKARWNTENILYGIRSTLEQPMVFVQVHRDHHPLNKCLINIWRVCTELL